MKLSNTNFYKRHNLELERYLASEEALHIINVNSREKISENLSEKLYVDIDETKDLSIKFNGKKYKTVILTDVVEVVDDIYKLISEIKHLLAANGKLIITSLNTKYYLIVKLLEMLKLKERNKKFSYIHNKKINNVASGLGFEFVNTISKQIFPFKFLGIGIVLNKILEILLFKFNFGIKTYSVFRFKEINIKKSKKTIIIPAKNEEGNLKQLVSRIPKFENCELIISCGESKDRTYEVAEEISKKDKNFEIKVFSQSGNGKANAIWESLERSTGDNIAILDADISVEPETLTYFFEIIDNNHADFVNGTRLIYEMEPGSMRYINKLGNRLFQFLISQVTRTHLTDSLCGTKVFKKDFIPKIFWWQKTFGLKDPFCDFDLIFSASYTGQKILEYPIHYKSRTYGKTQISRFRDGYKLINYFLRSFVLFNSSR
tara:strand:+ start:60362 stop:61657 length:1296 start_codon:yes stop_codon:yes gene_type:complete